MSGSPVVDDSKENSDKGSDSPVTDSELSEAIFATDESQNDPRTSFLINRSAPGTWKQRACKDMVPRKLENKPLAGDRMVSYLGLKYAIGPDKVPIVSADEHNLWNGTPQVISYFFMGGNRLQQEKITRAIEEWTWYANVVFMQASSAEESNVRIAFDPNDGSWSYIGRQCDSIPATEATMNLAWLDKFSPITANEKAVILHEFGHALGLLHEHQSPAHGNKAVQNVNAALKFYERTQGWTREQIYEQVINVYNKSDVTNYSQVDIQSIMHYPQPKELTGLGEDIPYNQKLSDLDKAYMILQYPRKTMHPQAETDGWSIQKALEVVRAPPDVTHKVLTLVKEDVDDFGEISPVHIREVIKDWTRATYGHVEDGGQIPTRFRGARPPNAGPSHAVADELDGNLSRFNKPVVVNEAEFNLTNALYPISPIVGGPNGQNLSRNYENALNGLIPTFESAEVRKQRERMRKWLLAETKAGNAAYTVDTRLTIPGLSTESAKKLSEKHGMTITPGDPRTGPMADQAEAMRMAEQAIELVKNKNMDTPRGMTRMEFSETLMQAYLRDRQAWEEEKDKMISESTRLAATDPRAMNELTRRLAHISALQDAKLSAKYGDAVIRSHSHTVRGLMGHLDIKTAAESLQDATDSFQTGLDRTSDLRPDVPPSGTPERGRMVRGDEKEPGTTPQDSSTVRPLGAAAPKPADILDALRMSLESGDFADWAKQQPEDVKDEIIAKVMEAFGKKMDKRQD